MLKTLTPTCYIFLKRFPKFELKKNKIKNVFLPSIISYKVFLIFVKKQCLFDYSIFLNSNKIFRSYNFFCIIIKPKHKIILNFFSYKYKLSYQYISYLFK